MDQGTLVESRIDAGQQLIDRLTRAHVEVTAACWAKGREEDQWALFIASPIVQESGVGQVYSAIHAALQTMPPPWITLSELNVIGATSPMVKDLLTLL